MEEPGPLAFARENVHLIRHQEPEDDRRWRIIWGRRGEDTRETEGPTTYDPPEAERDLGAGQGWQGGENGCGTWRKKQVNVAGRRDERWRLAGGGCGKITGGQRTT